MNPHSATAALSRIKISRSLEASMSKLIVFIAAALGAQEGPILEKGVGNVHYAVSTRSADAQKFFEQGMAYLYGFNHEAAIRSFKKASELDPDMAMAYWGIALALGPNINLDVDPDREKQAYEAVQMALKHEANASLKEHDRRVGEAIFQRSASQSE